MDERKRNRALLQGVDPQKLRELLRRNILDKINVRRVLQYALYLFLALVTQNMLLTQLRIAGVCPMVLPAVAVAVGMFEGPVWGALISLILGIFADLAFVETRVLFTLLFPALAFATNFVSQFFINRRFFAYMGAAALGLLATGFVQMIHILVIDSFAASMLPTVLLQTLWSLPFAVLAYLPVRRWIRA